MVRRVTLKWLHNRRNKVYANIIDKNKKYYAYTKQQQYDNPNYSFLFKLPHVAAVSDAHTHIYIIHTYYMHKCSLYIFCNISCSHRNCDQSHSGFDPLRWGGCEQNKPRWHNTTINNAAAVLYCRTITPVLPGIVRFKIFNATHPPLPAIAARRSKTVKPNNITAVARDYVIYNMFVYYYYYYYCRYFFGTIVIFFLHHQLFDRQAQ